MAAFEPPAAIGRMSSIRAQARPSAARRHFDACEAIGLAVGELEATFAPKRGMVGVSLCHAGEELPAGEFELADRRFDDGYDRLPDGAEFSASDGRRTITVTRTG
jgi:hypothetical protein